MIGNFFKWMNKHDYFISGAIVFANLIGCIQSIQRHEYGWATVSLIFALAIWYVYVRNVNAGEPKYKE